MNPPRFTQKRYRANSWLAWTLFGIVFFLSLINLIFAYKNLPVNTSLLLAVESLYWSALPIVFSFVAALIISRQPRNRIGWLLIGPALLFVLGNPINTYLGQFSTAPPPTVPILLMTWFTSWTWLVLIFPLFFLLLLFPTGAPLSSRWGWVLFFALGMCGFFILFVTFGKNLFYINGNWTVPNPIGWIPDNAFDTYFTVPWSVSLWLLTIASGAALFFRYRRASTVERLQIKWLLFAGVIFVIFYIVTGSQSDSQDLFHDITNLLFTLSILLFPIAIAISILRYRLWDIDVIIRKTLVYAILTALLALTFFGCVILLQWLFTIFTGTQNSPLVVVVSTLLIAALFTPLRNRIQNFIDRRFFRTKYNAGIILEQFAVSVRNEVEMDQLTQHLLSVVKETVQPESVGLWLKR